MINPIPQKLSNSNSEVTWVRKSASKNGGRDRTLENRICKPDGIHTAEAALFKSSSKANPNN